MNKLSDDEIMKFLKNMLQIPVTRDQLVKPTKELVLNIYTRFLQEFGIELLSQPDIMACSGISNIEYMSQIIFLMNLFKSIAKFIAPFGINDFSLQDLHTPKRNRTNRILSALCSFYIRFVNIKDAWLKVEEQYMNIPQRKSMVEKKILELKHVVEEKSMLLSSLKNKSVGMDKQLAALDEKLMKKKNEAEKHSEEFKEIKSRILSMRERVCELNLEISKLKENNTKVSQSIVRSPMKIINEKNDLEKQLEILKEKYSSLKSQNSEKLSKVDFYKKSIKSLKQSTEGLGDLFDLLNKTTEKCDELDRTNKNSKNLEQEIKSIGISINETEVSKQKLLSQGAKDNKKYMREKETLIELVNGLEEKLKMCQDLECRIGNARNDCEDRLQDLDNELKQLDIVFDGLMEKYTTVYNKILEKNLEQLTICEQELVK